MTEQDMARNRPRREDEDVINFAIETGRITSSGSAQYRAMLASGQINDKLIEALYPAGRSVAVAPTPARSGIAYAASPAVDEIRATHPVAARLADAEAPGGPKLFGAKFDRDLPIITASGFDPQLLLELPWPARHAAAMEADRGKAYSIFEDYADDPDAAAYDFLDDRPSPDRAPAVSRNREYLAATRRWAAGTTAQPRVSDALTDAEYRVMFPDADPIT